MSPIKTDAHKIENVNKTKQRNGKWTQRQRQTQREFELYLWHIVKLYVITMGITTK